MSDVPSLSSLTGGERTGACPICDTLECPHRAPPVEHRHDNPLLPGGGDLMADKPWIIAPHRVIDPVAERIVYGTGDRVPIHDAIRYGLLDPSDPRVAADKVENLPELPAPKRGKRGRETRHHDAPGEDR